MNRLLLELPSEALEILGQLGEPTDSARDLIVLELYRRGLIAAGKAAEWLGMGYREFLDHAAQLGIPAFRYPLEEMEAEVQQLRDRPS